MFARIGHPMAIGGGFTGRPGGPSPMIFTQGPQRGFMPGSGPASQAGRFGGIMSGMFNPMEIIRRRYMQSLAQAPQARGSAFVNPNFMPPNSMLLNPRFGFGVQPGSTESHFIAGTSPTAAPPTPWQPPKPPEQPQIDNKDFQQRVINVLNMLRDRGK